MIKIYILGIFLLFISGCSGMKVNYPQDKDQDSNTKVLSLSEGKLQIIDPYVCRLKSQGKHFSALGKTENEARQEVLAKCKDRTLISFCKPDKISCSKNK